MIFTNARVIFPDAIRADLAVTVRAGKIVEIGAPVAGSNDILDLRGNFLAPGFIDLHVHGGGGAYIMDGAAATAEVARLHARHGTTSLLATTVTAPLPALAALLPVLDSVRLRRPAGGARILGVHLEGPYINPGRLGAQPPHARTGQVAELRQLIALAKRTQFLTAQRKVAGWERKLQRMQEKRARFEQTSRSAALVSA